MKNDTYNLWLNLHTHDLGYSELQSIPPLRPPYTLTMPKRMTKWGMGRPIMKFGDECKNGHNTFSITMDGGGEFGGCCHDLIKESFSEFAHLIKWHLVSTDGPLHYLANTIYHAESGDLHATRTSAISKNASLEELNNPTWLEARLPDLMEEFAKTMFITFPELEEMIKREGGKENENNQ